MSGKLSVTSGVLLVRSCFSFFLLIFFFQHSIAQRREKENQGNKYRAVHWGVDEGLGKERWHNAILKDVNGFLWFGSNHGELSRFDGSSFKQYDPDKNKPGTIRSNNCLSFVEDSLHNIWIGRFNGLSRYNIKADTFTNFLPVIDSGATDETIIPFWATRDELFCIESGSQITSYNIHSFARKKLQNIVEADKVGLDLSVPSYAIFDSVSNSVWMLPVDKEGLVNFSLSTGKVIYHSRPEYKKWLWVYMHHHDAGAMCYDRNRNCIWINSHDGLEQFTFRDQQFHHIDALNPLVNLPKYDRYVGIDIDQRGRVWLATMPKGLIIYDPATQSVTEPFADSALQREVANGNLKIYCDRDGMVWTSFWSVNGIYQLIPFSPSVHRYTANAHNPDSLSSLVISNMIRGDHNRLWIGTQDEGLNIFNPETGSFKVLREKDLPGIKGKGIAPMVIDTLRKKAWLNAGPPDRVYEMDIQTQKCKLVVFKDTANRIISPVNIINYISGPYRNGFIFFDAGYGIFEVNGDSSVAQQVIAIQRLILKMVIGEDHKLFLRTPMAPNNLTYYNINGKWIKTAHPLDSIGWSDMFYDKTDQTYWVSVTKELIHYSKDFRKIRSYRDEEGLMGEPLTIIPDGKGNIWFNNDRKAISRLNIKTGIITRLSEKDGYQKQFYDWFSPQAKEAGGDLYFAGNILAPYGKIGLDRVSPDKFAQSPSSIVYVNSLKINQQVFPLSTGVNNLQKLSLRYFENKITIETGIIDYYSRGKSHIRYRLEVEGKNAIWEYAPSNYVINYEELPPGKYRLVMQASNAANKFNGPEKSLLINISPAFWNTWWFRIAIIICVVALIYGIIRFRLHQKFRLQLQQSEKEKQLAELRHQKTELEMQALRAQMNPHFIFNSLNSINHFILLNNKEMASEYLTKFSRLVRLILQNSQASLIPLESELESLQLYLELEALRFNHHFEYNIIVEDDLDVFVLEVPPLIIQPYTENAIWHGLMHKEEKGHLEIEIYQQDDYVLCCKITDDGIGRKKAAELKSKSASAHKSMGMRITADRIAILQQKKQLDATIKITDLVLPDGSAGGTEVLLKIPVML